MPETQYIPDPTDDSHAYLTATPTDDTLLLEFTGPTRHHLTPVTIDNWVKTNYDVLAHKTTDSGREYTFTNDHTDELLTIAEDIAQYTFGYWWALNYDGFDPSFRDDETYVERESRLDVLATIDPDGTVTLSDGGHYDTPYTRDSITTHAEHEWQTPVEECAEQFNSLARTLLAEYPEYAVEESHAKTADILTESNRKQAQKARETLSRTLEHSDGIGPKYQDKIKEHFDTLEELCLDLHQGASRLDNISGLGEKKIDSIRTTAQLTDMWDETKQPAQPAQSSTPTTANEPAE